MYNVASSNTKISIMLMQGIVALFMKSMRQTDYGSLFSILLRNERSRRHAPSTHIPAFSSVFAFSPTLSSFEHFLAEFHHLRRFHDPRSSGHQQSRTHSYFCYPSGIGGMDVSASSSSTGSWVFIYDAHHDQYCSCEE